MSNTFFIIDDDINIRKMLCNLISKNNLGRVVAELNSGEHAVEEILFYNPDIVLIDLLLPFKDGVQIIEAAKKEGFHGKFIMISQVEDQHMIARAYENGIVFFIGKPINMIEAINVIRGVCHNIELERSVQLIKSAVLGIPREGQMSSRTSVNDTITQIFTDIGIIGESGSKDLMKLINKILDFKKQYPFASYQLQDFYHQIAEEEKDLGNVGTHTKTIEQRIRRTILKALENVSALGYDDYDNNKFVEYSTSLFDLKQVKQEMKYMENALEERGKINIRKFIEGIVVRINIQKND
ncbi:two-component system response regulator YcbB [Anaerosolibacter carboniphilus]|uniref:Stage 0 sporulation protein A homolog n=1 Tax=Anaerosolibacter carboniphilus TaxID=1417629 RepID=A0A841L0M7_9FIRM|nr:response regulator [Anaerosolibacter carboniphilus]MBB6215935.1 two-component system response regulator YcbB [Anaerosolibacter carboniphilus]